VSGGYDHGEEVVLVLADLEAFRRVVHVGEDFLDPFVCRRVLEALEVRDEDFGQVEEADGLGRIGVRVAAGAEVAVVRGVGRRDDGLAGVAAEQLGEVDGAVGLRVRRAEVCGGLELDVERDRAGQARPT
jgi:hypothetical protein